MSSVSSGSQTRGINWSPRKEETLKSWQSKCQLYSWAHSKTKEFYQRKHIVSTRINISLSVLVGIIGAISTFMDSSQSSFDQKHVFDILVIVMGLMNAGYSRWLGSYNPEEKAGTHGSSAQGYQRLVIYIDMILSQEISEREDGTHVVTSISKQMTDLSTGAINIPQDIWIQVLKLFKHGDLEYQPDNAGTAVDIVDHESHDNHDDPTRSNASDPGLSNDRRSTRRFGIFTLNTRPASDIALEMQLNRHC